VQRSGRGPRSPPIQAVTQRRHILPGFTKCLQDDPCRSFPVTLRENSPPTGRSRSVAIFSVPDRRDLARRRGEQQASRWLHRTEHDPPSGPRDTVGLVGRGAVGAEEGDCESDEGGDGWRRCGRSAGRGGCRAATSQTVVRSTTQSVHRSPSRIPAGPAGRPHRVGAAHSSHTPAVTIWQSRKSCAGPFPGDTLTTLPQQASCWRRVAGDSPMSARRTTRHQRSDRSAPRTSATAAGGPAHSPRDGCWTITAAGSPRGAGPRSVFDCRGR
jgi:hypothetical protein